MDIRKLQRAIVDGLEDVKGQNIAVFNTEHLSPLFERVIIASGTSNRQTKALASSVRETVKKRGMDVLRTEGEDNGEWIIVDCGAAVAHILQPAMREYYNLEEIWGGKAVKMKLGDTVTGLVKASEPDDGRPAKAGARAAARSGAKPPAKGGARPARAAASGAEPAGKSAAGRGTGAASPAARKSAPRKTDAQKQADRTAAFKRVAAKTPARKRSGSTASVAASPAPASRPVARPAAKAPLKVPAKAPAKSAAKAPAKPAVKAPARKTGAKR
jgi:ribosome-associated protein